jgi:hypothetical protein
VPANAAAESKGSRVTIEVRSRGKILNFIFINTLPNFSLTFIKPWGTFHAAP